MKRLALGILLTSIAGSAYAADLPAPPSAPYTKAPAIVSPATNWSGFYIGGMGGYANNSDNQLGIKGGFVGGTVGYNWQYSQFVFGLEGDGAWAHATSSSALGAITATAKVDALSTIRGRFGVAIDQVLLYGTGGFALADAQLGATAFGLTISDSKTLTGWTVGAGAEWMFLPRWSVKAEYLYRSFSSQNFFTAQVPGGIPTGTVNVNSGEVGINYHF